MYILYRTIGKPWEYGQSECIRFMSNLPAEDFNKAYEKGCEKLRFRPHELCMKYKEKRISKKMYDKIVSLQTRGLLDTQLNLAKVVSKVNEYSTEKEYVYIYRSGSIVELILAVARAGNKSLECSVVEEHPVLPEYSFGHGLFS